MYINKATDKMGTLWRTKVFPYVVWDSLELICAQTETVAHDFRHVVEELRMSYE